MNTYFAIVHKDENSAFGVSFPDLPFVFSAAENEDHIVTNAIEALSLWAEDQLLAPPTSLSQIRKNPDVKEALSQGAFLVRIPLIEDDSRIVRANVTFEAGTLRAIDEEAKRRGLTRAAFLASAARKEIQQAR